VPSTFDPLLRLELQATGENENTWGDKANNNFELLGDAIAGHVSVVATGSGDLSLSTASGSTDEARRAFITLSGTLTGTRNIIVPTASKTYFFRRNTSGNFTVNVKTASGASAELPAEGIAAVVCDGLDCWTVQDATKFPTVGGQITGAVSVSVSTSTSGGAAFTIKQTGGGPALVVEDANSDATPFMIDATGAVFIGTSVNYTATGFFAPPLQIHRAAAATGALIGTWVDTNSGSSMQLIKSRGADIGTNAAVSIGDTLGRFVFAGDAGDSFVPAASILVQVAATVSTSVVPGQILFQTAGANGTLATRATLDQNGNVGIGTTAPTELLHIEGNFRISDAVVSAPVGAAPFQGCRAYISYAPDTATVKRAFNVASVTQNGTGDFTIAFETSLVGNSYIMMPWGNGASRPLGTTIPTGLTAGAARVQFRYTDTNALQDPTEFHIAFIQ
jgi:hypothetical protein